MRFGILGPLEVAVPDGRVVVRGRRRRALLVRLLVSANDVVPSPQLLDEVWEGSGHAPATSTLTSHVQMLREVVGRDRLVSRDGGYVLRVDAGELDLAEFEADVDAGRRAVERGEASGAAASFHHALGMWRGAALADVVGSGWADRHAARAEQLRRAAIESLLDAQLRLGRHDDVVTAAEVAVADEPLRERRWATLMLALYRSGRQADALRAYQRLRAVLGSELGIDPSPGLTALDAAILRHDPALVRAAVDDVVSWMPSSATLARITTPPAPPGLDPAGVPALPAARDRLIGREPELAALGALLTADRLVTLVGVGGIGKTRLALDAARSFADGFGTAAFIDLSVCAAPSQVESAIVTALRVPLPPGVSPAEALVARLRGGAALLVLDNAEHVVDVVAGLAETILDRCPACRLLVTSRQPLHVPGERVWPVEPLEATSTAVELFEDRLGGPADHAEVVELCRRLDGIPLAIELAAATCRTVGLGDVIRRLDTRFDLLLDGRPADRRHASLRATLEWSHELLGAAEQRLLRRLAVFNGSFGVRAVEAVCGPLDTAVPIAGVLASLVDKSLVVFDREQGRHRLLETVRLFAAEGLDADERARHRAAHARWYLDELLAQPWVDVTTMRPFLAEASNLLAAADWWTERGHHREVVVLLSRSAGVWVALMQEGDVATRALAAYERCRDQLTSCEHAVACALFGTALRPGRVWRRRGVELDPELACRPARSNAVALALADADHHPARTIEAIAALRALPGGLDPDMRILASVAEAQARCRLDDIAGVEAVYARLVDDRTSMFWCGPMLALATVRILAADLDGAEELLALVDQHPHRDLRLGPLLRRAVRTQLAVARGDLDAATTGLRRLEVLRDQYDTSHRSIDHIWFETAADLAAARGDLAHAARLAAAAEHTMGDGESSPFVTWTLRRRHRDDPAWCKGLEHPVDLDASRRLARDVAATPRPG